MLIVNSTQIDDVVHQLFSALPADRLSTFSCGHIIPPENLQTLVLKKGPRGGELQFKYQQRGDEGLVSRVSLVVVRALDFCNRVDRRARADPAQLHERRSGRDGGVRALLRLPQHGHEAVAGGWPHRETER